MSIISTSSTSSHLAKPFVFHTVHTSRKGYVKDNCTMRQIKNAAADYVRVDSVVENREQFGSPKVFVSEHMLVEYSEPKDTAKAKTVCSDPTANGIVFVPIPSDTPPQYDYQPHPGHNNATTPFDIKALLEAFRKESDLRMEALQRDNSSKFDALQQRIIAVEDDNEDLKQRVDDLTQEGENKDREIEKLKGRTVILQARIEDLERGYADIHGWLSDASKDTEYMDRIRLRHILDCGQARLARSADVPVSGDFSPQSAGDWSRAWRAPRSLLANCPDVETRDMPEDMLRYFTVRPSDTRTEGDRIAHPAKVGESVYKAVIEWQPEDQRPLLRQVVAYGLQFRS
ncbi:uncharacterized protein EV420DRAFT_1634738 [Desarmillaria tabescens]|uniref:Uncharacterized protein n=1 Tax=Armillaria tabescens TaxID=1929756 RepID=A0AA39NR62_ARMTA|nr:uncharacterized protein EV420DRAFT_1634738 [Desarmillaria tabescens]KAK0470305.1 hypothetical protein EV420DRAFT_1634738 [Desarmillaria tabescens]